MIELWFALSLFDYEIQDFDWACGPVIPSLDARRGGGRDLQFPFRSPRTPSGFGLNAGATSPITVSGPTMQTRREASARNYCSARLR